MLKKQFRITKDYDFKKIYKRGNTFRDSFFIVKIAGNKLDHLRFGFVVSKKTASKSVDRNKIKRQLSEIARTNLAKIKPGFDIIIIANKQILGNSYQEIENRLINIFQKARIYINKC